MRLPSSVFKGRDLIEGLIPRDGAMNAVVHVGVGLAAAGGVVTYATSLPNEEGVEPDQQRSVKTLRNATKIMAVGAAPLFLTAGMMLNTPTSKALPRGVTPNYFLAAGAVLGAAYVTHAAADVLAN
jgi:hypothetical protein